MNSDDNLFQFTRSIEVVLLPSGASIVFRQEGRAVERKRMKIIRLMPVLDWGGVETRIVQFARRHELENFEFRVCTFWEPGEAAKQLRSMGTPVDVLDTDPAIRNPFATWRLLRYLKIQKPDILHASIPETNLHGSIAGFLAGVPCRIIEEVGDPIVRSFRADLMVGLTMHLATHCVGVSRPMADYIREQLFVPAEKVYHIDNGVPALDPPADGECEEVRRKWGIPEDAHVIGSVGRLDDKHKRFSDLMDAIAMLHKRGRKVWLMIVGDGDDREKLEDYARKKGLENYVVFTGFLSDVRAAYCAMDIFALLSEQEAFGLVVAEAMFCELPTVVSSVGGMQYVVEEGATGFIVPRFEPATAAKKLDKLLADPELRNRLGTAGRKRALKQYSAERYVSDVEELYRTIGTSI